MLFTSQSFILVFLPLTLVVVAAAIALFGRRGGLVALTAASSIFYAYNFIGGSGRFEELVVIVVSILFNFSMSRILGSHYVSRNILVLALSVSVNLLILGYYKYTNFIVGNLGGRPLDIVLPLAISFYTFQQIAFVVDAYRGQFSRAPFLNYVSTVLFFPHLIAGPLIHYRKIMKQFDVTFSVSLQNIWMGLPYS